MFCLVAVLLHISPFRSYAHHSHLFFTLDSSDRLEAVLEVVNKYCKDIRAITMLVNKENALRNHYGISLNSTARKVDLMKALQQQEGVKQPKFLLTK
ncbi:MAG: hypothetical protein KF856_15650 [Cyclobacteriaceae bacterium]|nr:hypothetical protein [Cyclobacteriaceae bacterium]